MIVTSFHRSLNSVLENYTPGCLFCLLYSVDVFECLLYFHLVFGTRAISGLYPGKGAAGTLTDWDEEAFGAHLICVIVGFHPKREIVFIHSDAPISLKMADYVAGVCVK